MKGTVRRSNEPREYVKKRMGATLPADALDSFREFQANLRWAKEHDADLEEYAGQFVGVSERRIAAVAASRQEVVRKTAGKPGTYVTFVVRRGIAWLL